MEEDRHKRPRFGDLREENMEEDRLSLLPDWLIIVEILSRLELTKEAIRTGILSKRWLHLWTLVPNLAFDIQIFHTDDRDVRLDGFYSIVDQTITQCPLNINKLHIFIKYHFRFESNVNNWIHYAINRNVHEFHLLIPRLYSPLSRFVLPQSFFFCSCFTILELDGCILNPTGSIAWENLKSLSISHAKLCHDLIQNILSGSPLLETFKLDFCYGFTRIDITSKSVKNLVFSGFFDPKQSRRIPIAIEINAPYTLSLAVNDILYLQKLSLLNVSSLIKAELNYKIGLYFYEITSDQEQDEMLNAFILRLLHVKELTIGKACLEVE